MTVGLLRAASLALVAAGISTPAPAVAAEVPDVQLPRDPSVTFVVVGLLIVAVVAGLALALPWPRWTLPRLSRSRAVGASLRPPPQRGLPPMLGGDIFGERPRRRTRQPIPPSTADPEADDWLERRLR